MNAGDLAAALATRLDAVVPVGMEVIADGDQVVVRRGDVALGGSAAPRILDGSGRQLETAARATIGAVQDVIAEEPILPWPAAWCGPASDPALSLAPFAVTEAGRPAP